MRLGLFTLPIALLLGTLHASAGESQAWNVIPEKLSLSPTTSAPATPSMAPMQQMPASRMTITCAPTRSAPWQTTEQAIEAYNNAMATAVTQHNEAIAQAYADMESEHAEALDMLHTQVRGKHGDDVADEMNQAFLEYNQALESANVRYSERISQIRADYDAATSQATVTYESVMCPGRS